VSIPSVEHRLLAAGLVWSLGCGGGTPTVAAPTVAHDAAEVTRYRLLLSENTIDPGGAFRCYGACQRQEAPEDYLRCLSECPGFEQTPGIACAPSEVPPLAACFTARPVPVGSEPKTGAVVIAVIANVALVVGLASICASQTEPCSYMGAGLSP
jgi:hypothetical protein